MSETVQDPSPKRDTKLPRTGAGGAGNQANSDKVGRNLIGSRLPSGKYFGDHSGNERKNPTKAKLIVHQYRRGGGARTDQINHHMEVQTKTVTTSDSMDNLHL